VRRRHCTFCRPPATGANSPPHDHRLRRSGPCETPAHRFAREEMHRLILEEFPAALGFELPAIPERWVGTYAYSPERPVLVDTP
jgi:hypothetical protein